MSEERRRTKVVINDKEYTIIGKKSAAHVELVAQTINEQLKDLNKLSNKLSKEEQAILVAVNAVSDQIQSHQKMLEFEKELDELTSDKTK